MELVELFLLGAILFTADVLTMVFIRWRGISFSSLAEFSSGLFTAFVFLQFLPELFSGWEVLEETLFSFLFLGFAVFFIIEICYVNRRKAEESRSIASVDAPVYYVEFFIEGMAIFFFLNSKPFLSGLVLLSPFILSTVSASLALTDLYKKFYKSLWVDIFFDAYPLLGIFYAFLINPFLEMFYAAFAFVSGFFLYLIIKRTSAIRTIRGAKVFMAGMAVCIAIIYSVRAASFLFTL